MSTTNNWHRVILLVDMNAFFAQVEQRHNPILAGKPIMVSGNPITKAVVAASSYEAKAYGVKSGMSLWEARKLCPKIIPVEGNPDKYLDHCKRIVQICREFTDLVELYSIDEAYLDITGVQSLFGSPQEIACKLKKRIKEELSLTCSIGIAPNKLLAKMASGWKKPDGLTIVYPHQIPKIIWHLPVEELFGVGERLKSRLERLGITTIERLAKFPQNILKKMFGTCGEILHQFAWGIDDTPVAPENSLVIKSIGHSYTLPANTDDMNTIKWFIFWLSDRVARRLRKENLAGKTISITVRGEDFSAFSRSKTIFEPTIQSEKISEIAIQLFEENYKKLMHNKKVRLLGVSVSNLFSTENIQLTFFGDLEKTFTLHKAIDKIKDKYGDDSIKYASLLVPPKFSNTPCGEKNGDSAILKKVGCFLTKSEKK